MIATSTRSVSQFEATICRPVSSLEAGRGRGKGLGRFAEQIQGGFKALAQGTGHWREPTVVLLEWPRAIFFW